MTAAIQHRGDVQGNLRALWLAEVDRVVAFIGRNTRIPLREAGRGVERYLAHTYSTVRWCPAPPHIDEDTAAIGRQRLADAHARMIATRWETRYTSCRRLTDAGNALNASLRGWLTRQLAATLTPDQERRVLQLQTADTLARQTAVERSLVRANLARTTAAAARTVTDAAAMLADPCADLDDQQRMVLQVRVDHPGESLAELAGRLDVTKDAYAAALRRTLARASRQTARAAA